MGKSIRFLSFISRVLTKRKIWMSQKAIRYSHSFLFLGAIAHSFFLGAIAHSFLLSGCHSSYRVPTVREKSVKNEKSSRSG